MQQNKDFVTCFYVLLVWHFWESCPNCVTLWVVIWPNYVIWCCLCSSYVIMVPHFRFLCLRYMSLWFWWLNYVAAFVAMPVFCDNMWLFYVSAYVLWHSRGEICFFCRFSWLNVYHVFSCCWACNFLCCFMVVIQNSCCSLLVVTLCVVRPSYRF